MPRNGSGVMSKPAGTTAVPNTTIESAKYNATIDDIIQDLNTARPIVAGGTGATNAAQARDNLGLEIGSDILGISYAPPGLLSGLTLSNDAGDLTNDIAIAVGSAASDGSTPALMALTSAMTKRTDAAWAAGTGNGGWLDGASMPNGTGHVFLIQRSDTGAVDVGMSASVAPSLPTNYDRKRRIGSVIRESGSIVAFRQNGDVFRRVTPLAVAAATSSIAAQLFACGVPLGIVCAPILRWNVTTNANSVYSGAFGSATAGVTDAGVFWGSASSPANRYSSVFPPIWYSDTSGQIFIERFIVAGSIVASDVSNLGWVDTRGRT